MIFNAQVLPGIQDGKKQVISLQWRNRSTPFERGPRCAADDAIGGELWTEHWTFEHTENVAGGIFFIWYYSILYCFSLVQRLASNLKDLTPSNVSGITRVFNSGPTAAAIIRCTTATFESDEVYKGSSHAIALLLRGGILSSITVSSHSSHQTGMEQFWVSHLEDV